MKKPVTCIVGVLLAALVSGCSHIVSYGQGSLGSHVEFMKRAGEADRQTRGAMRQKAEKLASQNGVQSRLRLGLLLTTPGYNEADMGAGAEILVDVLENAVRLNPDVRDLVHVRLQEVNERRRLGKELHGAESKIDELMSIEKNMEADKDKTDPRR